MLTCSMVLFRLSAAANATTPASLSGPPTWFSLPNPFHFRFNTRSFLLAAMQPESALSPSSPSWLSYRSSLVTLPSAMSAAAMSAARSGPMEQLLKSASSVVPSLMRAMTASKRRARSSSSALNSSSDTVSRLGSAIPPSQPLSLSTPLSLSLSLSTVASFPSKSPKRETKRVSASATHSPSSPDTSRARVAAELLCVSFLASQLPS
mmetsp:Transcript_25849/g.63611  ORF Transcript_25849/g.63611 Transcript_25849/m.63611 type:complete len:207 (+) Transcript_25849:660-1280(+)